MTERVVEYLANAVWQLPLLAAAAWWLLRAVKPGPLAQHRVWLAVLGIGVLLPLARVSPRTVVVRPARLGTASVLSDAGGKDETQLLPTTEPQPLERVSWVEGITRRRSIEVSAGVARRIAALYLVFSLLALLRLVRGWIAARRLIADAEDMTPGVTFGTLLHECGEKLGIRLPRVVESGEVSSPAVVGQVLVLPHAFEGFSEDEMRASLLHELAHLRRKDYAANLMCELGALPVAWHPVSYAVRSRIRSTREMQCDVIAAGAMGSANVYARSLVGLATKAWSGCVEAQPLGIGLFTNNNLEERVMRLIETKQRSGGRAKAVRMVSAVAGMAAGVLLACTVHLTPALAQTGASAAQQTVPEAPALPALPGPPPALSAPAAPALPVAPALPAPPDAPVPPQPPAPPDLPQAPAAPPAPDPVVVSTPELQLVPGEVLDDGDKDCPMGHATHVHRWLAADGKNFAVVNCNASEPTVTERKSLELKSQKQMADLQRQLREMKLELPDMRVQMAEARKQVAEAKKQMNSPEFRKQMAEVSSPEFEARIAKQLEQAKKQVAESRIDTTEVQRQLDKLNSPEFQAQIERQINDAREQVARSRLDSLEVQRQLNKMSGPELQKQIKDAQKQIDNARKLMKQNEQWMNSHPEQSCVEGCPAKPE